MEFLILALLGLAIFGMTEAFGSAGSDSDESEEADGDQAQKSPEQKLLEAISDYESNLPKDKRIKISFEMQDRE